MLLLSLNDVVRAEVAGWSVAAQWVAVSGAAAAFGLLCQMLMIGAQGAFAQVLPVWGGRSIRGGAAAGAGWLLMAAFVLTVVAVLLLKEAVETGGVATAIAAGAAFATAGCVYAWHMPAAQADFGDGFE